MASKKALELDERLRKVIDDTFANFEQYLPGSQDVNVYRRKRKEYWDKIAARLAEEALRDGRADNSNPAE